jgi:para-aminobenzoate synthetase/4-amino-4-deoxychorismate lyase
MVTIKKNDVLLRDQNRWLHFRNPYKIIIAESLDQVVPALAEIERLTEENDWHAAGFLSYESASAFDQAMRTKPTPGFPYLWFGLYPQPLTVILPKPEQPKAILEWQPTIDRDSYDDAVAQIKEYISQGKTYQVNYTMRLQAVFSIRAWDFFLYLAQSQNNHAAYIDTGRYVICSASPELFFELDNDTITCRPMKGTVKRGRTTMEDREQADWLKNSKKNRAENVMIVDMIRNDLGRIAKTGSIRVPELCCLEGYPTLWQMTSTITAQTNASLTNIIRALFPCASITGAPKVRTMQIIDNLETTPRKIYTGSIGYISPHRKAKFNVAIRTLLIDQQLQKAEYGVGGGIVWDSMSTDEYAEAVLKARLLTEPQPEFSLLETMLWTPTQGFYLREKHIKRLLDSAEYFDFPVSRKAIEESLDQAASAFDSTQRVRLLLDKAGTIKIESIPFQPAAKLIRAHVAKTHVDSNNVFLFHKTTHRSVYENAQADFPDCDDVLLYNQLGELTEFTIGNLVVELDGQLITPKDCGLLAGTFRAYLVETGQVVEKVIPMERLRECTQLFRVNSIRKWEKVEIQQS